MSPVAQHDGRGCSTIRPNSDDDLAAQQRMNAVATQQALSHAGAVFTGQVCRQPTHE